jgi:AAT family amino acid transporter/GABA permease
MISIGGIIGAGLFVGSSTAIIAAGPAIVLSYALAGILVLLIMRMLGEMAVALPEVRSFTEFSRVALGPGVGFVVGWLYWYFWVIVVPVEAIAGAKLLQQWIPISLLPLGLSLMGIMTTVNLLSARSYAECEFWFASIKVFAIIVFIVIAASHALGWVSPHMATFGNLTSHGGFMPHGALAVLAGVPTVFFALTGAEITTVAAAESAQPSRAIAGLTTTVIWRIMVFYVISIFLIVSVVPWDQVRSGESPFTLALNHMRVPWAGTIMSGIILTAVLSCLNSAFYVCSRVLFVLAANGDASQSIVKLNKRQVPARSVMIGAAAGILGILAATEAPQHVFDFLVSSAGAVIVFVYMAVPLAQIRLRRQRERAGEPLPSISMWWFPWGSYIALAAMVVVLVAMAFTPGLDRDLGFSVVTLVVAVLAYLGLRRRESGSAPS